MKVLKKILIDKNFPKNTKILDIGCGDGELVQQLIDLGFDCYGADIGFKDGQSTNNLIKEKKIVKMLDNSSSYDDIDEKNYSIPFENNSFDVVISDQTIEHVKNLDQFISESYRVLKKNGVFYSYFPSKHKIIEPHVGTPFGGIFNSKLYIRLCCLLGLIKSKYKYPNSHIDIYNYLKENTFYRNEKTLKKAFEQKFREVNFNSKELLLAFKKDKNLFKMISSKLILYMPFGIFLYKIFISKFLECKK